MTGCQAELANEEFEILYVDESGNVIVDEVINSLSNGFIELWLPRNVLGELTITHNDMSSTSLVSTFDNDLTCLTTMELK